MCSDLKADHQGLAVADASRPQQWVICCESVILWYSQHFSAAARLSSFIYHHFSSLVIIHLVWLFTSIQLGNSTTAGRLPSCCSLSLLLRRRSRLELTQTKTWHPLHCVTAMCCTKGSNRKHFIGFVQPIVELYQIKEPADIEEMLVQ